LLLFSFPKENRITRALGTQVHSTNQVQHNLSVFCLVDGYSGYVNTTYTSS